MKKFENQKYQKMVIFGRKPKPLANLNFSTDFKNFNGSETYEACVASFYNKRKTFKIWLTLVFTTISVFCIKNVSRTNKGFQKGSTNSLLLMQKSLNMGKKWLKNLPLEFADIFAKKMLRKNQRFFIKAFFMSHKDAS